MNIIQINGTTNTTYKADRPIKYIVLHYTAGTRSDKGQARNVAYMFKNGGVGGSADFIVDDVEFVQYNGDIKNRYCWSVGGQKYPSMSTSQGGKYYNKCTNTNSISIEMCSTKINKSQIKDSDTDWYFTDAVINNAVELTKYLMSEYKIPIENVLMHHHITGKKCPLMWCLNESKLSGWYDFKKRLEGDGLSMTQYQELKQEIDGIFKEISSIKPKVYNTIEDVPEWGKATVKKLIDKGYLKGTDKGLNISYDLLRLLVLNDRAGLYD